MVVEFFAPGLSPEIPLGQRGFQRTEFQSLQYLDFEVYSTISSIPIR
ncbi:MAG: hypothetical protein LM568_02515 [Desulfurococcaceae archaeon]|nr:hypothetical protein [Desulfurococcaceae archaeon]